jgi:ADP-ribosylglycohydrolase
MAKAKKTDDKDQSAAFIEAARELGCDDDPAHFDEMLKKVARHKPAKDSEDGGPQSPPKSSKEGR